MKNKKVGIVIGMLVIFAITAMVTAARTSNIIEIDDVNIKNCGCGSLLEGAERSPPCLGDVNLDGDVNTIDLGLVEAAYGGDPSLPAFAPYDVNYDGQINTIDAGLVQAAYGPCP